MKYTIDDLRISDTKDIDVTRFFPTAEDPVIITIRRLPTKKRNDVVALMMMGQRIKTDKEEGSVEITDTGWYQKTREIELLNGVIINEGFPFEQWNEQFIDEIDGRCPEFIQLLQDEIQEFNRPLAMKNGRILDMPQNGSSGESDIRKEAKNSELS